MAGFSLENIKKQQYAWTDKATDDIWCGGPCDSIEECVKEAIDCGYEDGSTIAVGLIERYKVEYINGDHIIELLQEEAYDEIGEVTDDWLDSVTMEQREDLSNRLLTTVLEWLKEYKHEPSFYKVHPLAEPVVITIRGADQAKEEEECIDKQEQ